MKGKLIFVLLIVLSLAFNVEAANIKIYGSTAPNSNSPSYTQYKINGLSGVQNGGINVGDPLTDPTAFEIENLQIEPFELIATPSVNSWQGDFTPTAPFDGQFGNRFGFWALVEKTVESFVDLQKAVATYESVDNLLNFTADYSTLSFNGTTRWGINFGGDGVLGGGDDSVLTSGNTADALVIFFSNTYTASNQADFLSTENYVLNNTDFVQGTVTYDGSLQQTLIVNVIPEPSSFSLIILSISALFTLRKFEQK